MKTIILHLIREDIKQTRFIQQLNNLGLSADEHLLNLSPVIFDLMELDRSTPEKADEVQERYMELNLRETHSCNDTNDLLQQSELIYNQLIFDFKRQTIYCLQHDNRNRNSNIKIGFY